MSTYYWITLDAKLTLPEDQALAILQPAMEACGVQPGSSQHMDDLIFDGIPFETVGQVGWSDLPDPGASGWTIAAGRLHAGLFVSGLFNELDDPRFPFLRMRHQPLFEALAAVLDAQPGDIVGSLASENSDCAGPLLLTTLGIRAFPSRAANPLAYDYEFVGPLGEHPDPVVRIPLDAVRDLDDGIDVEIDRDVLVAYVLSERTAA